MQVKELGHLVLYVRNLERSRRFYRDLLGWKEITVLGQEIGFPAAAFSSGRTHHELLLIEVGEDATPIPKGRRDVSLRTQNWGNRRRVARGQRPADRRGCPPRRDGGSRHHPQPVHRGSRWQ